VSKKKSAKKKARPAAATRRKAAKAVKATKSRSSKRRPRVAVTSVSGAYTIQLKPIKDLIDRAIADLQNLQENESIVTTIKQLQSCAMTFEDICDPDTPGGCGPTMEFPPNALLAKA